MKKLFILPALSVSIMACSQIGVNDTGSVTSENAVSYSELKDGLTPTEFRAYGKTSPSVVSTRMGNLEFTEGGYAGGFPTAETSDKLHDELDFQRATQAYLWAMPIVSYARWLDAHENVFNASEGEILTYKTAKSKQGILTCNVTTPYAISFANLKNTGPLVFKVPKGPSSGIINDMWQRGTWDFGLAGPDRGKGAQFIILAPGMEVPKGLDESKYTVVRNTTNTVYFGIRALQPDAAAADAFLAKFEIYPYSERNNAPKTKIREVSSDISWGGWQPHGMAYWDAFKKILDREVVAERDRLMLSMLDSLGLKKGEAFNPNERQKRILKEAAVVGYAMGKAISFDKRFDNLVPYKGTHFENVMAVTYDDRDKYIDQMYRRAAWTTEAVTRGKAYEDKMVGAGQQYLSAYKDADGNLLEGSKHYTYTMPANPPAKIFWSVVVYDVNTRTPIFNDAESAVASSRSGVKANDDGSVTLHFSPTKPDGVTDENWIQTNSGESWFPYIRFYGPTESYFDQSFPLQDVELVK